MSDLDELKNIVTVLAGQVSALVSAITPKENSRYTFFEWLDKWFNDYKAATLSDGGYKMRLSIDKHIKPNIENKRLAEYSPLDISEALNRVSSDRMRQMVRCIYNQCFAKAVRLELLGKNPIDKVDSVKHKYNVGRALTADEQRAFLFRTKGNKMRPLYMFYLLTGVRRAEALAIKWEDIRENMLRIPGTKTKNAERTLPLFPQLKRLLASLPRSSEYIFPYSAGQVRKNFERLRAKLPFQNFTLHDLRHTFATRCLESGVAMKTVQKWLGHSKYNTTADIYSHISTEFEADEIQKFSAKVIELKSDKKGGKN